MQADGPAGVRLAIAGLDVRFGDRQVVDVDELHVGAAEIVGLAGESGSGKSMTTLAVLGLAHTVGATVRGSITLDGTELTRLSQRELRDLRGRRIAAIFQSPAAAFSPVFQVGSVVDRALRLLEVLRELRDRDGMSVLFISHDLAVVAELCDRVAIMRQGRIVEQGPAARVLSAPADPYTADLLAAVPVIRAEAAP